MSGEQSSPLGCIFIALLVSIVLTGFLYAKLDYDSNIKSDSLSVIEYDGCEYVIVTRPGVYGSAIGLAHKGNCKYCAQRQKVKAEQSAP